MPDPFDVLVAEDFGGGIYRGREAPPGSVYTAYNALIDDEGQPFRRGTSAYYSQLSDATGAAWTRLHALFMHAPAANRVLAGRTTETDGLYVLDEALGPVAIANADPSWSRPAMSAAFAVFAKNDGVMRLYGGSLKSGDYSTGTASVAEGTTAVTGAGTTWTGNVDPGMILVIGGIPAVVKSIESNTAMTLMAPWPGATAAASAYSAARTATITPIVAASPGRGYVASGSGLLLYGIGNRVYYANDPLGFTTDGYHELPANVVITGLESRGTSAVVFTTGGVWTIENLYLDAIDDFGNIQRPVEQVNKDLVLWDDYGVAAWDSSTVVPAIDDVYLVGPDFGVRTLSEGIRSLYRTYVRLGYQCGLAAVHRGHYFLPIMNGTTLVDVLVCRLDRPFQTPSERVLFPWTSWGGHAAGPAYAVLTGSATRSPKLLGLAGLRVTDLSDCMEVTTTELQDADATTPQFTLEVPLPAGGNMGLRPSTASFVRSVYETVGGTPVVTAYTSVGDPATATVVAATLKRGGGASDGTDYSSWAVNREGRQWMVRLDSVTQTRRLLLRRVELTVRRNGR